MSKKKDNKTIESKIRISYKIFSDCSKKLINFLKDNKIKFQTWQLKELAELDDLEPSEESAFVEVEPEIYQRVKKLSEVTGIPVETIVSSELGDFFNSVGDIPVIFLDRHLGIKNIKKPIEMLEKMDDIINIGSEYLEDLKTMDLVKHVENWCKPFKRKT